MKKIINKKIATIIAAATIIAFPLTSYAVDKLTVKDLAGETAVFKVDDTGTVLGAKLGMGTTTPQAPLHLNLKSVLGVLPDVGTLLYNTATGYVMSTQDNSASFDATVADGTGTTGYRGAIRGVRARGTLSSPTAAAENDLVMSVIAGIYDGAVVRNTADINFTVDGPVYSNAAPARISFRTRTGGTGAYYERLTIKNDGKIGIGTTTPTSKLQVVGLPVYENNSQAIAGGLTAGAFYRTSTGVLMVAY